MQISVSGNNFVVRFPYNPALVAAVKLLPSRRFDPANKYWTVQVSIAADLRALLARLDCVSIHTRSEDRVNRHDLAGRASLSQKQAALGQILTTKYRRQLGLDNQK